MQNKSKIENKEDVKLDYEEIKEGNFVRNKKYKTIEFIKGQILLKDSQKGWVTAVLYTGPDHDTGEIKNYSKEIEEFRSDFEAMPKPKEKFTIYIKETLSKAVEVEARCYEEAYDKVKKDYLAGNIVLTAEDYCDTEYY